MENKKATIRNKKSSDIGKLFIRKGKHMKKQESSKHKDNIKTSNLENENINAAYKEKKRGKKEIHKQH